MANPIIQRLNSNGRTQSSVIQQAMGIMRSGNIMPLLGSNPQFKKLFDENKDLTAEQVCQKYGLDPSILNLIK